ncbi:MAG: 30S ribosomal protein S3, partial [Planctomycetota bacterium]
QLSKRASFRRTMKQYCELAMNAGAKGVKIICAGRLAGSEMARRETQKLGSIPLHTLDANVDYAVATSRTTYGAIGVKVWIYKGKFGEEIEQSRPARRRRPPRRISTGPKKGKVGLKTVPVQDRENTAKANVVALPAEPDSGESNNIKTGVKNGNDAKKS